MKLHGPEAGLSPAHKRFAPSRALSLMAVALLACVPEPSLPVGPAAASPRPTNRPTATPRISPSPSPTATPSEWVPISGVVRAPETITPAGAVNMSALGASTLLNSRYQLLNQEYSLLNLDLQPLPGVFVQAFDLDNRPMSDAVVTGSDGVYRIARLPRGGGPYVLKAAVKAGSVGPFVLETLARPGEVLFHDIDIATTLTTAALIRQQGKKLSGVTAENFERAASALRRRITPAIIPLLPDPARLASEASELAQGDQDFSEALDEIGTPTVSPTPGATDTATPLPSPVVFPTPRPTLTPWPPLSPGAFAGVVALQRITPFSGGPSAGFADGSDTNARFDGVRGFKFDATGALYAADRLNNAIRRIVASGQVTTLAGDRQAGPAIEEVQGIDARFRAPSDVAIIDNSTLVVADTGNHQLRWITHTDGEQVKVKVLCGDGLPGYEEGFPPFARLNAPVALAYDGLDTLFVADVSDDSTAARILAVDLRDRDMSPNAAPFTRRWGYTQNYAGGSNKGVVNGPASSARFVHPAGLAVRWVGPVGGAGSIREVWVADREAGNVRRIVDNFSAEPVVTTVLGPTETVAEGPFGWRDTLPFSEARFNRPTHITFGPGGNLFIADTGNAKIRWVRFAAGAPAEISSLKPAFVSAGGQSEPFELPGVTGIALHPTTGQIFLGQPTPGRLFKME